MSVGEPKVSPDCACVDGYDSVTPTLSRSERLVRHLNVRSAVEIYESDACRTDLCIGLGVEGSSAEHVSVTCEDGCSPDEIEV